MDLSRYADLFLTESREHLSAINHALLQLERDGGGAEPVGAIFRAVHTIKGMSATMGYAAVAELAHELESLLDQVRRGEQTVGSALMDALFQSADALESAIERSVAGKGAEIRLDSLLATLRALGGGAGASTSAASRARPALGTAGPGVVVTVRLHAGTPMRGVRAILVLHRAQALGEVVDVSPSEEALQAEEFDAEFSFRLVTSSDADEIERALLAVGDVERVEVAATAEGAAAAEQSAGQSPPRSPTGGDGRVVRQQRHVRIDLRRLDVLMNLIGELVITRGRLAQLAARIGDPELEDAVAQASRLVSDLQDQIMTSRLVPVWQIFDRFPRLVRDAARSLGKTVDFVIEGKEIELDRSMLDEIGDPIVHLLRNAVDHGIEPPDVRRAAGKRETGRLVLSATRDREAVLIRVTDDGQGIDRARVLRRARELGLVDGGRQELTDEELIRLIGRPGFSTAERVTDISGRGVGIDAVQARVRALGGSVDIRSAPGQGTSVTVRLPLTLAIVRALLARVGDETYALPMTHVNETVHLDRRSLRTVGGREVLMLREDVLPLVRLRERVRLPAAEGAAQQVIVLEMADRRAGLIVDELTGQQEVVVKQFDAVRDGLSLFSGATILGDGAPALIVDVSSLL